MRRWIPIVALAAVTSSAYAFVQEEPVAIVVDVSGSVTIQTGEAAPVAATVGASLLPGDRIVPADGGTAMLLRVGGQPITVNEPVVMASREAVDRGDMFTRTVGVLAQAATTNARNVPNRQGMIRPIPGEPTPLSPRNGIVTLNAMPTFTWASVEGATGYTIQIRRAGAAPMRLESPDTVFTVTDALEPGHTYYWTVAAGRRAAREDSVRIATPEQHAQIDAALASIREMGLNPEAEGRVLSLIVYVDSGLYYEALGAIEGIESTGAPVSADVLLLKGEILDALGRIDDARAAFDAADALMGG